MPLTERENYLRTASLMGGEWIPCSIYLSGASRVQLAGELERVVERWPRFFPGFVPGAVDPDNPQFGPTYRQGERFTDNWGCVWDNIYGGLEGQIKVHPLADDAAFATFVPPDPLTKTERGERGDWEEAKLRVEERKARGQVTHGSADRFWERLHFVRGFERFMLDLAEGTPQLEQLLDIVLQHNLKLVHKWLEVGVDVMHFGDDLGTQTQAMVSPELFRRRLLPCYSRMMQPCREAGSHVYLHSDGYIMELMDVLIEAGVTIINPQDLCNGIDDLAAEVKGRIAISLDVDRQTVVPFGKPADVRELIKEEVMKLGSPQGGLMFIVDTYPPTPAANIEALCEAFNEFQTYWWDGRGG
jgi:uroporphyrinogen decarboxylase